MATPDLFEMIFVVTIYIFGCDVRCFQQKAPWVDAACADCPGILSGFGSC